MGAVEDIILRHGQRGMDVLREYCPPEFCREAAECIFRARRGNVLLLTGDAGNRPDTSFVIRFPYGQVGNGKIHRYRIYGRKGIYPLEADA